MSNGKPRRRGEIATLPGEMTLVRDGDKFVVVTQDGKAVARADSPYYAVTAAGLVADCRMPAGNK